jgi:hypothetical protein
MIDLQREIWKLVLKLDFFGACYNGVPLRIWIQFYKFENNQSPGEIQVSSTYPGYPFLFPCIPSSRAPCFFLY